MKYALLIYSSPGAGDHPQPATEGFIDSWVEYTAAIKEAGVLVGAERLAAQETATSVTALNWAAKMPAVLYGTVEVRPVREGEEWRQPLE